MAIEINFEGIIGDAITRCDRGDKGGLLIIEGNRIEAEEIRKRFQERGDYLVKFMSRKDYNLGGRKNKIDGVDYYVLDLDLVEVITPQSQTPAPSCQ